MTRTNAALSPTINPCCGLVTEPLGNLLASRRRFTRKYSSPLAKGQDRKSSTSARTDNKSAGRSDSGQSKARIADRCHFFLQDATNAFVTWPAEKRNRTRSGIEPAGRAR